jgi:FkbM family methyltransferase
VANLTLKFSAIDSALYSNVGRKVENAIVVDRCDQGAALYGPYVSLDAGEYLATVCFDEQSKLAGRVLMDVVFARGITTVAAAQFDLRKDLKTRGKLELPFYLEHSASGIEVRLQCLRDVSATIAGLELACLDPITGDVGLSLSRGGAADLSRRLERVEMLCRGGATYLGNNRILAKVPVGSAVFAFLMPADDLLLMPWTVVHGEHEPQLTSYFATNVKQTDHCLDIGANYGYYTCLMAQLARQGKTIGVEPSRPLFDLARDNISINSLQMFGDTLHAAVSDRQGKLTLYRRPTRSGNTSITKIPEAWVQAHGEPPQEPFEVDCVSIDDLQERLNGKLDIMKIDVEGAEPLAFRGAKRAIASNPGLKIVMEWAPLQIQAAGFDVRDFLTELAALRLNAAIIHEGCLLQSIPLMSLADQGYMCGVLLRTQQ